MDFLSLLVGGDLAGSDGPNGLVGDDDLFHIGGSQPSETFVDLTAHNLVRDVGFTFGKHFADADHSNQARGHSGLRAPIDGVVRLAKILTALAVPDDNV